MRRSRKKTYNMPRRTVSEAIPASIAEVTIAGLTLSPFRYGGLNIAQCGDLGRSGFADPDWATILGR